MVGFSPFLMCAGKPPRWIALRTEFLGTPRRSTISVTVTCLPNSVSTKSMIRSRRGGVRWTWTLEAMPTEVEVRLPGDSHRRLFGSGGSYGPSCTRATNRTGPDQTRRADSTTLHPQPSAGPQLSASAARSRQQAPAESKEER